MCFSTSPTSAAAKPSQRLSPPPSDRPTRWLDARDAAGRRRLDDPADYVRHEVALSLRDAGRVIPILLDGTRMPSADELPDEIRPLAICNAMVLSNRDWQRDVDLIVDEVRKASFAYRPASPTKLSPCRPTSNAAGSQHARGCSSVRYSCCSP
jgi:hypothetical protein